MLRYKKPGEREFRVPFNLKVGGLEIPVGLGLVTVTLIALCLINLVTKQVATIAGVSFTLVSQKYFLGSTGSSGAEDPQRD